MLMWQQFEAMFADSCDELFPMCLCSLPYTHVFCIIPQDKICSCLTARIVSKNGGMYHIFYLSCSLLVCLLFEEQCMPFIQSIVTFTV